MGCQKSQLFADRQDSVRWPTGKNIICRNYVQSCDGCGCSLQIALGLTTPQERDFREQQEIIGTMAVRSTVGICARKLWRKSPVLGSYQTA